MPTDSYRDSLTSRSFPPAVLFISRTPSNSPAIRASRHSPSHPINTPRRLNIHEDLNHRMPPPGGPYMQGWPATRVPCRDVIPRGAASLIALTAAGALLRRAGTLLGGEAQTVSEQPPSSLARRSCIGWELGSNKALAGRASNSGTPQQQRQSDSFHEPQQSQKLNEEPISNLCLQPIRNAPVVHISRRKNSIIAEHYTQNNNNFTVSGTPRGAPFLQAQG